MIRVFVCVFKAVDILTAMDTDTLFMATGDINEHQPRQPTYSRPWVGIVVAVVVAVLVLVVVAFAVVVVINLNLFIWVKAVAVPVSHAARLDSWHWQAAIIAAKLQASFLPPPSACQRCFLPHATRRTRQAAGQEEPWDLVKRAKAAAGNLIEV